MMNERQAALMQVYQNGFAIDDILLYLDTHPMDENALAYYHQAMTRYWESVEHFENRFGPLFTNRVNTAQGWSWIDDPWPWEGGN